MYNKLLIIGAGAHVPYGMPTGKELTEILQKLNQQAPYRKLSNNEVIYKSSDRMNEFELLRDQICQLYILIKHSDPKINDYQLHSEVGIQFSRLLDSFCRSGVPSIDSYLPSLFKQDDEEKNVRYELAILFIAYYLSRKENEFPFGSQKHDWIEFLITNYLKPNPQRFLNFRPKILTFNYDRYLEHRIFQHLIHAQNFSEIDAQNYVDALKIVHVYGCLNPFADWKPSSEETFFKNSLVNIKTINRQDNGLIRSTALGYIQNAEAIYLLGFGFDPENCGYLVPKMGLLDTKKMYSTNIKMSNADRKQAWELFHPNVNFGDSERDSYQLIRDIPLDQ